MDALLYKKGSIALDGIALTINDIVDNFISLTIIPHTLDMTTLGFKDIGDTINIETDIKYGDNKYSNVLAINNNLCYNNRISNKAFIKTLCVIKMQVA